MVEKMSEWREDDAPVAPKKPSQKNERTRLVLDPETSVEEARRTMLQHITDPGGVYCPCCDSINKVYLRGIHWKSGVWLCRLVQRFLTEPRWYQVQEFYDLRGGDYAKLRYWGLAELRSFTEYDKRTSGMWRPTKKGCQFARGDIKVPAKVMVYQGKLLGIPEDVKKITIQQVLEGCEGHFSWSETMAGVSGVDIPG